MSRRAHLIDVTCLLMIGQTERYGRWHVEGCEFDVALLHRSNRIIPGIITDRAEYIRTARRSGWRHRTQAEADTHHRTLACWSTCSTVQDVPVVDDMWPGMPTQRHIITECTARCLAVSQAIRDTAALVGISVSELRKLAVRRHKARRYTGGDVPNGMRARAGVDNGIT